MRIRSRVFRFTWTNSLERDLNRISTRSRKRKNQKNRRMKKQK